MNRPHDTELALDAHVAQWGMRALVRALATYAVVIGVTILLGGRARFAGLSYEAALNTPGAPTSWGIWISMAGLVAITGTFLAKPRVVMIGTFFAALWCLLFASAFAIAALKHDQANTTGMWTYLVLAVAFLVLTGVHYAMRPFLRWPNRKATSAEA